MSNEPLDPLIDEVAREMTSAPADPQFARRVSMHIASAGDRRATWRLPWVLVPAVSACVLVIAVFVWRDNTVRLKPGATKTAPNVARGFQPRVSDAERVASRTERDAPALDEPPPSSLPPIAIERLDVEPLVRADPISIGAILIERIEISAMP